jgi:acyl-CoA synthetase (AMP-forming)/AMP-acid ligase II
MHDQTLLHHLIDEAAERFGDRIAVSHLEATVRYSQVAKSSRLIARWLHGHGIARGDRVVVLASTSVHLPALIYGASRVGAVVAIIHESATERSLEHVLNDSQPALLVTTELAAARPTAARLGVPAVTLEEVADGSPTDGAPDTETGPGVLAVDLMCFVYTSGSTAMPKAVVCTHQQMLFAARAIHSQLGYRPDDRIFCPLPFSFDYGLYQLFLAALGGSEVCLAGPAEAGAALLANLNRTGATVLAGVPSIIGSVIRLSRRGGQPTPPLRLVTNTGEALTQTTLAELRRVLPGADIQLMFGLTECKRVAIMPPEEDLRRPGSCGRPLPGTEVLVIDPAGQPVGRGEIGEFVVRGPHVMAGYWRRPQLTAQRFQLRDGLFPQLHTGDYGWMDDDGYLYFVGRRDDLYKERGFRVSCTEVEAAATRVPGVDSAAVLPPGDDRDHAVIAAVTRLSSERVLDAMRGELEEFKIPRQCLVIDRMPLTANGKVDRNALACLVNSATNRTESADAS